MEYVFRVEVKYSADSLASCLSFVLRTKGQNDSEGVSDAQRYICRLYRLSAQQDDQEYPENLEYQESQEHQDSREHQNNLDNQEHQELLDSQEHQGNQNTRTTCTTRIARSTKTT